MRNKLGLEGIAGLLLVLFAIALVTWRDPVIGAGLMILLAGVALVAKGLVGSAMRAFGMA
ncbi:hypothetical protein GCM10027435_12000 [Haloparvum alkalitolerans]|uniref:DUF7470 family protein n=1 Tax=Haloparvum TaxID=1820337 RepID=UPI00071E9BE0|nr:hypothetical protein [Haloparvum sedimenti]